MRVIAFTFKGFYCSLVYLQLITVDSKSIKQGWNPWRATMITDFKNVPCVVKHKGVYYKTNKTASFFSKHREMNNDDSEIYYIDEDINDRASIDKALSALENSLKGIQTKEKEVFVEIKPKYEYRLNLNTILVAYNDKQLEILKKWYNV